MIYRSTSLRLRHNNSRLRRSKQSSLFRFLKYCVENMQMKLKPNPKSIQTHKQSQSVNFLWGEMISFYEESVKQRLLVILSFVGIS